MMNDLAPVAIKKRTTSSSELTLDASIGCLPPSKHKELCKLLNIHQVWKDLAGVVQNRSGTAPRFTHDDVL